jgi:FkbM family methyltransferase
MNSLQFVPIKIADCEPFYVDLRKGHHDLLKGTPWKIAPWEHAEQHVMQHIVKADDVAFDIGANIGLHTVLLAKLIKPNGCLCVFEPNRELLPQLSLTVMTLGDAATLYPFALSNKSEIATLFVPEDASMGSLANWTIGRAGFREIHTIDCEVRRIDNLVDSGTIPPPDFIKCDVEGAELMVFQGGCKILNRANAPIIMFEANVYNARGFGLTVEDAKNYLASLTLPYFSFFEIQEDGSLVQIEKNHPIHSNVLAVPQSKSDRLETLSVSGIASPVKTNTEKNLTDA